VAHSGAQQDTKSRMMLWPDGEDPSVGKLGIVVMSNAEYCDPLVIADGIEDLLRNPYTEFGEIVFNGTLPRNLEWAQEDAAGRLAPENGPYVDEGRYDDPHLDRYSGPTFLVLVDHLYNPRYEQIVGNNWKYNLSYVRIDTDTHEVTNFEGEILETPVHFETARQKCQIWDTVWRGAGVPPALCLDDNGNPEILHVLSEETIETHGYYYVRFVDGEWRKTRITSSNHQWNSCYLHRDAKGHLHAYVIVGEGYQDKPGINYTHGGGRIEHWKSKDQGHTWTLHRDITPDAAKYPGWSFNNIQPVVREDGSAVDGMLLFYGWLDTAKPDGVAFLLDESGMSKA